MTDDHGLAGEGLRGEGGEEKRDLGHIGDSRELAVHCLLQHNVLDHVGFTDAQLGRLFGNLLVDQWCADAGFVPSP